MPQIAVQEVVSQVAALLDAEGSEHYTFDQDYMPNINGVQDQVVTLVDPVFGKRKFSEEGFRELNFTACFQANAWGGIDIDTLLLQGGGSGQWDVAHKLWTVLAVYPEFDYTAPSGQTLPNTDITPLQANPATSMARPDVRFAEPTKAAKRTTQEKAALDKLNIFAPGNNTLVGDLKEWSYFFGDTNRASTNPVPTRMLFVRPFVAGTKPVVAVSYLKVPNRVTTIDDNLEWPDSMRDLFVQAVYRRMSFKQGDGTTAYTLGTAELTSLLQALT